MCGEVRAAGKTGAVRSEPVMRMPPTAHPVPFATAPTLVRPLFSPNTTPPESQQSAASVYSQEGKKPFGPTSSPTLPAASPDTRAHDDFPHRSSSHPSDIPVRTDSPSMSSPPPRTDRNSHGHDTFLRTTPSRSSPCWFPFVTRASVGSLRMRRGGRMQKLGCISSSSCFPEVGVFH